MNANVLAGGSMILSCVFWVGGYIYSNENDISFVETNMSRGLALAILGYFICRYNGKDVCFQNAESFKYICQRSAIFIVHGWVVAGVQFYIPLPLVHTILSSGCIMVFVAGMILDGHKASWMQLLGVATAFLGVILTSNGQ